MSATHTPGPWGASCSPFDMAVTAIIDGKSIDLMGARGDLGDQAEVNITLAAAAPDLLEALEQLLNQFDSEIHNEYDGTGMLEDRLSEANHARRAIAKAKGEQP